MEVALDRYATTEETQQEVLDGARESLCYDRAYRGALAVYLETIPE